MQKPATAVYFYDLSNTFKTLKLSKKLHSTERQNDLLVLSQITMSEKFKSPLSSILMLCQGLISKVKDDIA